MFVNIRIIVVTISIIISACFFAGSYHIKNYVLDKLVSNNLSKISVETHNLYVDKIWKKYYPVINYLNSLPRDQWSSVSEYLVFNKISSEYLLPSSNMIKARILNSQNVLLDTNDIINPDKANNFIKNISNDIYLNQTKLYKNITKELISDNQSKKFKYVLGIYQPLTITNDNLLQDSTLNEKNNFILEFNFDIDDEFNLLNKIQYTINAILILTLSAIIGFIIYSTRKLEEFINKQESVALELMNAKALAESESKAKIQFLANVSHELRTPLNAIIGFSEIINSESMGSLNNEKYKEFVHDIHTSGVHLLGLINDILDFSKSEENKLEVNFEPIDLTKIIKTCLRMVQPRAELAKVEITSEMSNEHLVIQADPKRIKQIILNLLSNAIKFTPEKGKVNVNIEKNTAKNAVIIRISDSGVGMATQDLAKALTPFGQIENKLSKRFEGTGLGLPLTKKLVELMKGLFEIKSEPTLGTIVILTFNIENTQEQETSN